MRVLGLSTGEPERLFRAVGYCTQVDAFPRGATGDGGFLVVPEMLSILGCSGDELGLVLKSLGFWLERRPKRKPVPAVPVVAAGADATLTVADGAAEAVAAADGA